MSLYCCLGALLGGGGTLRRLPTQTRSRSCAGTGAEAEALDTTVPRTGCSSWGGRQVSGFQGGFRVREALGVWEGLVPNRAGVGLCRGTAVAQVGGAEAPRARQATAVSQRLWEGTPGGGPRPHLPVSSVPSSSLHTWGCPDVNVTCHTPSGVEGWDVVWLDSSGLQG